jgi:hypothetical protein
MDTLGRLSDRLRAWAVPYLRNVNQRYHSRNRRRETNPDGVDVFAEDWDTLVILDGCRYDTFAREHTLSGSLGRRESRGGNTVEFLRGNVAGRVLHDTVYVTANGQFHNYRDELDAAFHHVENVWQHDDAWNEDHHTVLPETTTDYALRAAERFPDKRLLVHYIQPHYPFVDAPIDIDDAFDPETPDFWRRVLVGDLSYDPALLREAYVENLRRALPAVRRLLDGRRGKTVVTSDHGNLLGERAFPVPIREWGHPASLWLPALTRVPWLVTVSHPRPDITSDPPATGVSLSTSAEDRPAVDEEALDEHLRNLGYRT